MKKIDSTVKRETVYIAICALVLSVVMQLVFAVIGRWDFTVLLGNLLGAGAAVFNFLMMGITVQTAVELEEKEAKERMRLSMNLRSIFIMLIAVIGIFVPVFNAAAVIIPLFFVRVAVAVRPIFAGKLEKDEG